MIEEMKALVPEIFNEAKQVYAEQYGKEDKVKLITLQSDLQKGGVTFDQARKEDIDPPGELPNCQG